MIFLRHLFHALLVGAAGIVAAAPQEESVLRIELRADAEVTERNITFADIAVVTADSEVKHRLNAMRVTSAPMVGRVERLPRTELDQLVRQRLPGLRSVEWSGAQMVAVRSVAHLVDTDALVTSAKNYLRAALGSGYEQLEINLASPLTDVELPVGEVTFKPRAVDAGRVRARVPVWVDVHVNGAFYRSVVVPLTVAASRVVYVAKRDLDAGAMVFDDDFSVKTEEMASDSGERVTAAELQTGLRLKKALVAGQMLSRRDLAAKDTVFRGEQVRLVVAEGAVMVEVPALVQHDARIGQLVKVRMEKGMDAVAGRLVSSGVVHAIGR